MHIVSGYGVVLYVMYAGVVINSTNIHAWFLGIGIVESNKWTKSGTPQLGMEFDTEDNAYKFYNKYSFVKGTI